MSQPSSPDVSPALAAIQTAQRHHVSMTAMADQKASILLAASLITMALTLAAEHRPATVALFATGLGSAVFAVMAMMPRMLVLRNADAKTEVNLLFCGHFSDMAEEDYVEKLKALLATPESTLDALSRDLFQMGLLVHQKKFRFLGYAYTVCLLGLLVTALLALLGRAHLI
jgi:uncharacterized integral membrane protein